MEQQKLKDQAVFIAGIKDAFRTNQVEAQDLAKQFPNGWMVCFSDSTPFRKARSGFISIGGGKSAKIVVANQDVAKNLAAQLDEKAVKNGATRVISMPVSTWATMRVDHLQGLIDQCGTFLAKEGA